MWGKFFCLILISMKSKKFYKKLFWLKSNKFQLRCAEYYSFNSTPKADILIIPGLSEFIERYDLVAKHLVNQNFRVAVIDLPGQGLSSRFGSPKTVIHLDKFSNYLDSMHLIIKSLKFGSERPLIFFGHSLGGFLSLYYQTQSNHVKSNYFIKPKFSIAIAPMMGLPVNKFLSTIIIYINRFLYLTNLSNIGFNNNLAAFASFIGFAGKNVVSSVSKASDYWKNKENIDYFGKETSSEALSHFERNINLDTKGPSWNWVSNALMECKGLINDIKNNNMISPTLMIIADDEYVTDPQAQKLAIKLLDRVEQINLPSCRHDILHEKEEVKKKFWCEVDKFMTKNLS